MPARTFADSSGANWEVFEVQRTTQKPGAVSAGLEHGWLAFVNGTTKRRLAPFPTEWFGVTDEELELLCSAARLAAPPREGPRGPRPSIRRRAPGATATPPASHAAVTRAADGLSTDAMAVDGPPPDPVEEEVRRFAREARTTGLAAIDAMVSLKALLLQRFPEPDSPARNLRSVRRWFVEAYYFQRET